MTQGRIRAVAVVAFSSGMLLGLSIEQGPRLVSWMRSSDETTPSKSILDQAFPSSPTRDINPNGVRPGDFLYELLLKGDKEAYIAGVTNSDGCTLPLKVEAIGNQHVFLREEDGKAHEVEYSAIVKVERHAAGLGGRPAIYRTSDTIRFCPR